MESIHLEGVRHHNLKNIDITIPKYTLVLITGLSGSGKSSLAFDTLYAEGQRRYLETLSTYARQFIRQLEKPELDGIQGISPAIALEQRRPPKNPRSTVGTLTEVYDYLRLLFARCGTPFCPKCEVPVTVRKIDETIEDIFMKYKGQILAITAPIVRGRKGHHRKELAHAFKQGFTLVRIDGEWYPIEETPELHPNQYHTIEIVVDRVRVERGKEERIYSAVLQAQEMTQGFVGLAVWDKGETVIFSRDAVCPVCSFHFPEIDPWMFSFSSPHGACLICQGTGRVTPGVFHRWKKKKHERTWESLPPYERHRIWRSWQEELEEYDEEASLTCPACKGKRLRYEAEYVRIEDTSIHTCHAMEIHALYEWVKHLNFPAHLASLGERIQSELVRRLATLVRVGVGYLTLDRLVHTLSTGELQRVRLATNLGNSLRGVLYVLDEPTIGLHPRDTVRLINILKELRDEGNTVVVVEHDETFIRHADYIIDLGPGAGRHGGEVIAEGPPDVVMRNTRSLTGQFLAGRRQIDFRRKRFNPEAPFLHIRSASKHNLKHIHVAFPLNCLNVVTGVSGSGKSTLVFEVLYPNLERALKKKKNDRVEWVWCEGLEGYEELDHVYIVDQSPVGKTPRSCPATYMGIFHDIRNIFARQETARIWGYGPGRFSFNVKEGQCPECRGMGFIRTRMQFLPDVRVRCERCQGRRYNPETLQIRWHGYSIADILELTVEEALDVFAIFPSIHRKLELLTHLALGYLKLGQPISTLSGGESQRLKLARELSKSARTRNIYLLDEPTTGLHMEDIRYLLKVFDLLLERGHTLIVIEHHPDVIARADYVVDLGPEGGEAGGRCLFQGPPDKLPSCSESLTGKYIRMFFTRQNIS